MSEFEDTLIEDIGPIPINAFFEMQLRQMLLDLADTLLAVEPALKDTRRRVDQLADFLRFEIDKTRLAVEIDNNNSAAIEQLRLDEIRLAKLEYLLDEFTPDGVMSSAIFIKELVKEIKSSFYGIKEEEDET